MGTKPPRGLMFVLSGASGAGKTALVARLRELEPSVFYCITATTRAPRPGEKQGVHYYFYTADEFLLLQRAGDLLESAHVRPDDPTWYGTPRRPVEEALARGQDVLASVDVQGAASIKARIPRSVLIFLKTPDTETLSRRLERRATEGPDQIQVRIDNALAEISRVGEFDYVVVNEDNRLDEAVAQVASIMREERTGPTPPPAAR